MKYLVILLSLVLANSAYAADKQVCAFMQDYGYHVPQVRTEIFDGGKYHRVSHADYIKAIQSKPLIKELVLQAMIAFGTEPGSSKRTWHDLMIGEGPDSAGRDLVVYKLGFKKKDLMKVGATKDQATRLTAKKNLYYVDHGRGDNGMGTVIELRGYLGKRPLVSVVATGGDNDFSDCPWQYNIRYTQPKED